MTAPASSAATTNQATNPSWLDVIASRYFLDWLDEQRLSLAISTYQTGKLFLVGRKPDDQLGVFERTFPHCMGMWATGDSSSLWLATRWQLWRLDNTLPPGGQHNGFDALFVPRIARTTGHLDIHDVAVEADGRLVFVNTLFGCLATLSERGSFRPLWRPGFLSALAPEDRCHLNGLALRDGRARYVSCVARTDVAEGWREHRRDGGCVLDVLTGNVVVSGLSMPHSPRWYGNRLWVLNSGSGELGWVDLDTETFKPLTFCPGYLRGLAFAGNHALVTLSLPRHRTFDGLPLDEGLKRRGVTAAQCGIYVIDLDTGHIAHTVRFEGLVTELYDVVVLPGLRRPMALGFKTTEIERWITIDDEPGQQDRA